MNYRIVLILSYLVIVLSSVFSYVVMTSGNGYNIYIVSGMFILKCLIVLSAFMTIGHGPRYARIFFGIWITMCCLIIFAGKFGQISV